MFTKSIKALVIHRFVFHYTSLLLVHKTTFPFISPEDSLHMTSRV